GGVAPSTREVNTRGAGQNAVDGDGEPQPGVAGRGRPCPPHAGQAPPRGRGPKAPQPRLATRLSLIPGRGVAASAESVFQKPMFMDSGPGRRPSRNDVQLIQLPQVANMVTTATAIAAVDSQPIAQSQRGSVNGPM